LRLQGGVPVHSGSCGGDTVGVQVPPSHLLQGCYRRRRSVSLSRNRYTSRSGPGVPTILAAVFVNARGIVAGQESQVSRQGAPGLTPHTGTCAGRLAHRRDHRHSTGTVCGRGCEWLECQDPRQVTALTRGLVPRMSGGRLSRSAGPRDTTVSKPELHQPSTRPRWLMVGAEMWSTSCGARAHPMQHPRIVTLLFTDVEGSTPLLASLGEAYVGVIGRQRAILTGAAGSRRGSGYPTGGDGCVFIFGSAGDAVAAAVEAQRGL